MSEHLEAAAYRTLRPAVDQAIEHLRRTFNEGVVEQVVATMHPLALLEGYTDAIDAKFARAAAVALRCREDGEAAEYQGPAVRLGPMGSEYERSWP